jgi:hypothetical protein
MRRSPPTSPSLLASALAAALLAGCASRPEKPATFAEAVGRLPGKGGPVVASLCCTHFGYVKPLWERAFASLGYPDVTLLDPNPLMTDLVIGEGGPKRYPETKVTVEVVSKVPIDAGTKASLGALLPGVSPFTANALAHYRREPGLFSVAVEPTALVR